MSCIESLILFKTTFWFLLFINIIRAKVFLEKYKLTPIDNISKDILNGSNILIINSDKLAKCSEGAYQISYNHCVYSEYLNINNQWYVFNDMIQKEDLIINPKNNSLKCSDDKDCFTNKCQSNLCQINENSPNKICTPHDVDDISSIFSYKYKCFNITGKDEYGYYSEIDLTSIIVFTIIFILLVILLCFYYFTKRKTKSTRDEALVEISVNNPNNQNIHDDNGYDSDATFCNDNQ